MKISKWLKASVVVVVLFLGFVFLQNSLFSSKKASAPTRRIEVMNASESSPTPAAPQTDQGHQITSTQPLAPLLAQRVADLRAENEGEVQSLDSASADAVSEQAMATLERIKSVPGAGPLVDEMVALLQSNPYGEISLDNLDADENGLVELNEDTIKRMIPNEEVRAKWTKLMSLVAEHPEVVAAIQGQGQIESTP